MQRLRTILAVTSVRLSIIYTLVFGLVAVVIVIYLTGSTAGILRRQIAESINAEVIEIGEYYQVGGINGLVRRLERKATAPGANLYVVADPTGQIIAGNVRDIDTGVMNQTGWTYRPFEYSRFDDIGGREDHHAIARVVTLPNGMRLLVGRDLGEPERYRKVIGRALFLALGSMLVLGILTWLLVGRRALKRLDLVSRSTTRIMAGDRRERLPVTGTGDEFDRLSTRLNAMLDRINMLDEGLRQVSDNIAHDLKTPLTRLRNKADAALAGKGSAAAHKKALEEVIADTDQIIKTFNALLMISRVESGSSAAELTRQDLSGIVADEAELYQPVAEEGNCRFDTDIEPDILVLGNRELLSQALSNLVDNALKYGRPEKEDAAILISLKKEKGSARICVRDNGPGIAEEDRARAVERFARLEASRTKAGNGLGLSLVHAVAKLHGGTLVLSTPEASDSHGLDACLLLPIEPKQPK